MFDEAFHTGQGTSGGRLKRDCLLSRQIPRWVNFKDRPALDQLVKELTDALSVRYEPTPTTEQFRALDTVRKVPGIPEDVLSGMVAFNYQARMDKLASSTWLVGTFRQHLADREVWPKADGAVPQDIDNGDLVSSRKRKSDQARMESNVPRLGKMLKEDGFSFSY
jgi:hypothetical protein